MNTKLTEDELVQLVTNIVSLNGTEEEVDAWLSTFTKNVPHPTPSDIIFYPDRVAGIELGQELTPAEIVRIALNYKPIQL